MAEPLSLLFKKPFFAFVILKHKQFVYLISFSYYNEINQILAYNLEIVTKGKNNLN